MSTTRTHRSAINSVANLRVADLDAFMKRSLRHRSLVENHIRRKKIRSSILSVVVKR